MFFLPLSIAVDDGAEQADNSIVKIAAIAIIEKTFLFMLLLLILIHIFINADKKNLPNSNYGCGKIPKQPLTIGWPIE
jgi:hypothetical protein